MMRRWWAQYLIAVGGGALGVLAFAPFHWRSLGLLALAVLFWLWLAAGSRKRAFALGFAWGMGGFTVGVSWLYVSLHVYGNMPAPLAALAILLFCAYLSLYPAFAGLLCRWLADRFAPGRTILLLAVMPASFVLFEYLRGRMLSGFPWLSIGYSQTPGGALMAPLAGFAPVVGVYGISLLLAVSVGMLLLLSSPAMLPRRGRMAIAGALLAVWAGGGLLGAFRWSEPSGPALKVSLLQGNIPQNLKWRADEYDATLAHYRSLVAVARGQLIVLPETALPGFLDQVPAGYLDSLQAQARAQAADILIGVPIAEGRRDSPEPYRYANSAISIGNSPPQRYDKQHLVAFGEFMPPLFSWVYRWLQIPLAGFTSGDSGQRAINVAGRKVAVNICYEDAFGAEIVRQLPEAELLVNLSNMAWYGRSLAADQHAQFSQMRALEASRWMLRATNTGVTAAINQKGEIVQALPQFTRALLEVEASPQQGTTLYSRWRDWPALLLLALLLALPLGWRGRDARPAAPG